MATQGKFSAIKLSYTIDNVTITRSIPDRLFNDAFNAECKDSSLSDYEALISVIYTLVENLSDGEYVQYLECEFIDDMGFRIKIVR